MSVRWKVPALTGALCVGLVAGVVSPAWAADSGAPGASPVVGGFAIGDGLEGTVHEQDGAFSVAIPVGPMRMTWDSRAIGTDDLKLGGGWSFGLGRIQTEGGLQVFPASGDRAYPVDLEEPSGLSGYRMTDVKFSVEAGTLPARTDGTAGPAEYAYVLRELGGVTTYFNRDGDPVVELGPFGDRVDREWHPTSPHRPTRMVDHTGIATELVWRNGGLDVRVATNLSDGEASVWKVRTDAAGHIQSIVGPTGARTVLRADAAGLLTGIDGASGARTELVWQTADDGIARVHTVRTVDGSGTELASRIWRPAAGTSVTGWPTLGDGAAVGAGTGHETSITDGHTRIQSSYNSLGLLTSRSMVVRTDAGDIVVQEQNYSYPVTDDRGVPIAAPEDFPADWSRPREATVVARDAGGATRASEQTTTFDEHGRPRSVTSADGSRVETEYDQTPAAPGELPIGLPLVERTIAADGQVTERRSELNAARTAVIKTEEYRGRRGAELTRTGLTEFTVDDTTGVVTEERIFPKGDERVHPVVFTRSESIDPGAGSLTSVETFAAGTPAETTSTSVTSLVHGGVIEQTDGAGNAVRAEYDASGRLVATIDAAERRTTMTYEVAATDGRNATTVTAPDGTSRTEVFDEIGRVAQILDNVRGGVAEPGYERVVESRDYSAGPGTVRVTDAWGAVTTTAQDAFGRVVFSEAPTGARHLTEHDDVARTKTTSITAEAGAAAELTRTETYDERGQVTSSIVADGEGDQVRELTRTDYVLSLGGDITTEKVTRDRGTATERVTTRDFAYSPLGELESIETTAPDGTRSVAEQVYDAAGNLVRSADGVTYEYDALNRPITEIDDDGETVSTTYWADGSRRSLDHGASSTTFHWDGDRLLNETHVDAAGDAAGTTAYLLGTERHARVTDREAVYFTQDRHGNVTELTDATGTVTGRYAYTDYGMHAPAGDRDAAADAPSLRVGDPTYQPFRFAGEYLNPTVAQTQHLDVRTYGLATMRFTVPDIADVDNAFNFANANPITMVDPTGRTAKKDVLPSVSIGIGIVLAAFSIGFAVFTGGTSLSGLGIAVTSFGIAADAYAISVGVGTLLSIHEPEWVAEGARQFFTSDAAAWSELALGFGAMAGVYAAAKLGQMSADGVLGMSRAQRQVAWDGVVRIETEMQNYGAALRDRLTRFEKHWARRDSGAPYRGLTNHLRKQADQLASLPASGRWSAEWAREDAMRRFDDLRTMLNNYDAATDSRIAKSVRAGLDELEAVRTKLNKLGTREATVPAEDPKLNPNPQDLGYTTDDVEEELGPYLKY